MRDQKRPNRVASMKVFVRMLEAHPENRERVEGKLRKVVDEKLLK